MLKPNAAQGLANVVIKLAPYFKLYSTYTTLYPSAQKIIETTQNESSIFETFFVFFLILFLIRWFKY